MGWFPLLLSLWILVDVAFVTAIVVARARHRRLLDRLPGSVPAPRHLQVRRGTHPLVP